MKPEAAAKLAIENIHKEGLTDIFPRPFEIGYLKNKTFFKKIKTEVQTALTSNSLQGFSINPIHHVLLPKNEAFAFRKCALMEPIDTIKYLALVLLIAEDIEKSRIEKGKKIIFSYRFKPSDGYLFDKSYNITHFNEQCRNLSKQKISKILVKCDISNFYDRLNLHRLECNLLSIGIDKTVVGIINQLLLFWSNRDSYSLPVGSNASRILAEASLIEVDNFLISQKIKFIRFVDDYRFFAPNIQMASKWLTILIERLSLEGLQINTSKTKLEEIVISHDENKKRIKPQKEFIIKAGYSGTIPTRFREPSQSEKKQLAVLDFEELIKSIKSSSIIFPEDVKKYLKGIIHTEKHDLIENIPIIVEKFPQFIPFVIDMLVKHKGSLPKEQQGLLSTYFSKFLKEEEELPEYMAIAIVRLIGTDEYLKKKILFDYFRNLKRTSGDYIGRATLEALSANLSRGDVIEIRQIFHRADKWEKRQIIKIVDEILSEDEKRPWFKNIKIHLASDLFSIAIFEKEGSKRNYKKRLKKARY